MVDYDKPRITFVRVSITSIYRLHSTRTLGRVSGGQSKLPAPSSCLDRPSKTKHSSVILLLYRSQYFVLLLMPCPRPILKFFMMIYQVNNAYVRVASILRFRGLLPSEITIYIFESTVISFDAQNLDWSPIEFTISSSHHSFTLNLLFTMQRLRRAFVWHSDSDSLAKGSGSVVPSGH